MAVSRREVLRLAGLGALGALTSSCARLWLEPASPREATGGGSTPLLVVIFLRGGADGLMLVPAPGEASHASMRQYLAPPDPLPLATGFGLHPELAALTPLVERNELAVIHAAGSPHPTRSHFDAQDFMESGRPGARRVTEGWMTRALGPVAETDPFETLAISADAPVTLRGSSALALGRGVPLPRAPELRRALDALYDSDVRDPVVAAGQRGIRSVEAFERVAQRHRLATGAHALLERARALMQLDRAGLGVRAAFLDGNGWDSHVYQAAPSGGLQLRIRDLSLAVAHLVEESRGRRELRVVVMTEFGRTVRPNGGQGTDHGHGGVMLVAGSRVRGGLVGDWPGLAPSALWEERDLPVANDFRTVLLELLEAHLGEPPPADTFPDFESPDPLGFLA
jgi:uncharacterized protein (DUF1501 family)